MYRIFLWSMMIAVLFITSSENAAMADKMIRDGNPGFGRSFDSDMRLVSVVKADNEPLTYYLFFQKENGDIRIIPIKKNGSYGAEWIIRSDEAYSTDIRDCQ